MELREGYMQTEVGVIPDDWEVKELKDLAEKIMVGIASAATHAYRDNGVIMFRNQNIKPNFLDDSDLLHIAPEYEIIFKNKRLKAGDLLTARTGYPGTSCMVPSHYEGTQSFTTLITRLKAALVISEYLCFYINSERGQSFFEHNQIGGGQKNVNAGTLKLMPIPIPPTKSEQTAIAIALSDVDVLISSLEKLIEKKRANKQGTLQLLLKPRDGWKVKQLKDIAEFKNGKAHEQFIDDTGNYIVVNSKFVSTEGDICKKSSVAFSPLNKGEIAMVMSDIPNGKALAKCFLVKQDKKYTLNQRICSIISEVCDNDFLFRVLNRNKYFLAFDSGTGQTNLKRQEVLECPIPLPPTIEEQSRIATVLSDMDSEISALEHKMSKYKMLKQGMMQELLTGKLRLL